MVLRYAVWVRREKVVDVLGSLRDVTRLYGMIPISKGIELLVDVEKERFYEQFPTAQESGITTTLRVMPGVTNVFGGVKV